MPKRQKLDLAAIAAAAQPHPDPVQAAMSPAPRVIKPQSAPETEALDLKPAEAQPMPEAPSAPNDNPPAAPTTIAKRPSRKGRVQITGWFADTTRKRLKLLAVEEDTSVEALLGEGIELLFAQRKRGGKGGGTWN